MSSPTLPKPRSWPVLLLLLPVKWVQDLCRAIRYEREKRKPTEELCPYGRGRCSFADGSDCQAPDDVLRACERAVMMDESNWNQ